MRSFRESSMYRQKDDTYRPWTKEQIVAGLRQGHPDVFDALIDKYGSLLWHVMTVSKCPLRDERDAEEALNDIMFKIYRRIEQYRPTRNSSFKNWICAIANHHAVDMWRAKAREAKELPMSEVDPSGNRTFPPIEAVVEPHISNATGKLVALLEALPPAQRDDVFVRMLGKMGEEHPAFLEIFHMRVGQGLLPAEIADYLGKPANWVSVTLSRAENWLLENIGSALY